MRTRKRAARPIALAAMALLLAGCVRVNMDVELSPDNTVSGTAVFAVDENVLELTGQTPDQLFQDMDLSDMPENASVEPYEDDGFIGQQITFDDVALSEFSGEALGGTGDELSITREGDEFHVSGRLDMSGSEFGEGQVPPGLLDSFEFRISVTFPGEVKSATGEIDGNTVTWEPRVGQNTEIRAIGSAIPSASSPWLLIALVAAGALILGAVAFILVGRRKPAPTTGPADAWSPAPAEAAAGAGPVDEPAAAPPAPVPAEPPPAPPAEPPAPSGPVGPNMPPPGPPPSRDDDEEPPPVPPVSG